MENIEKTLVDLIDQGFNICLPGGTGKNGSNAALCCLVYRLSQSSDSYLDNLMIYIVPVKRGPFKESRISGKRRRKLRYEDPMDIARREVREEMNISIDKEHTFVLCVNRVPDDRYDGSFRVHDKFLLLSEKYDARCIRKRLTTVEPNLGIPMAIPFRLLNKYLMSSQRWTIPQIETYAKFRIKYFPLVSGIVIPRRKRTKKTRRNSKIKNRKQHKPEEKPKAA